MDKIRERVLVVEDNAMNMELVSDLLIAQGFTVMGAEDADVCWAKLRANAFDLILMDLQLPDKDGYTLVREIKQDPALATIPIVALTAYAMAGDQDKALAAGCAGVITKPIDTQKITRQIEHYLKRANS